MSEWDNGQALSQQDQRPLSICGSDSEAAQGFTAERVLRTRPKTYRAVVRLLADPHASVNQIAKLHRVSTHTVRAIRAREAQSIAERKQSLISIFGSVAEMSAERMEELCGASELA
jgi:transposase-like protein